MPKNLPQVINTNYIIDPSPSQQKKYLKIYEYYSVKSKTLTQVAKKFGISIAWACKIMKWVNLNIDSNMSIADYKREMETRTRHRIQRLNKEYSSSETIGEKMMVMREVRLNDRLLAQVEGLTSVDDAGDGKVQVNVQINNIRRDRDDLGDDTIEVGAGCGEDETEVPEVKVNRGGVAAEEEEGF